MPLVSIILPCYNARALVMDAIDSIRAQTISDWELIVVDDGSTDGSADRVETINDSRISLVRQKDNQGYPTAMNVGITRARGKYICRMDADDVCLPQRLSAQLEALRVHPEAGLCGIARFRITPGGKKYIDRNLPRKKYILETWNDLLDGRRIFTDPSVMVEKENVLSVGGYRTFQRSGMDVDLWLRVMERFGPCVTIVEPLFGKRLEPGSIIFNPETRFRNQVPRLLALQRKATGKDQVSDGRPIDLQELIQNGLVTGGNDQNEINIFYGAITTCIWFGDWKGAMVYVRQARKNLDGRLSLIRIVAAVAVKLIRRFRINPYVQYNPGA